MSIPTAKQIMSGGPILMSNEPVHFDIDVSGWMMVKNVGHRVRDPLNAEPDHECTCPMDVLMTSGCKCGGK